MPSGFRMRHRESARATPELPCHRAPARSDPQALMSGDLIGVALALASAIVWGSGDFSGGLATRRCNPYGVVAIAAFAGILALGMLALVTGERWPIGADLGWALLAGVAGTFGLVALYRGLAAHHAAVVAPVSAVVGALVPIVYAALAVSLPGIAQQTGFAIALLGIWLVTRPPRGRHEVARGGLADGALAGLGFGAFFVLIAQVERGTVFAPLVVARSVTVVVAMLTLVARPSPLPAARRNPTAWLAGALDTGGNALYLLALQYTRVDIAAVLSSLYPATTVMLSSLLLGQVVGRAQWLGVGCCLAAVALIAL